MANRKMNASTGYFNKQMLDILSKGEKKPTTPKKPTTAKKSTTTKK